MEHHNEDILRRLARLEKSDDDMRRALQELIVTTTRLNEATNALVRLEPTIRDLEKDQQNNTMVVNAVKWGVMALIGTVMSVLGTAIIRGGILG